MTPKASTAIFVAYKGGLAVRGCLLHEDASHDPWRLHAGSDLARENKNFFWGGVGMSKAASNK